MLSYPWILNALVAAVGSTLPDASLADEEPRRAKVPTMDKARRALNVGRIETSCVRAMEAKQMASRPRGPTADQRP
jgi:hypothetical protein